MKQRTTLQVWSIRQGIFGSYFILIVALCFVLCVSLLYCSKSVFLERIGQSRVDVLKQIAERTQAVKNSMITLSNLYANDESVTQALALEPSNVNNQIDDLSAQIQALSTKYNDAYKDINLFPYVVVVGENGFSFCSNPVYRYAFDKIKVELWYKDVVRSNNEIFWVSSYRDTNNIESTDVQYVFSAARLLSSAEDSERVGLVMVNIDERQLYDTYANSLNNDNSIFIVNEKGTIVSHQDQDMLGLNYYDMARFSELFQRDSYHLIHKGKEQYLLSNAYDAMTGWTIVEEIPVAVLLSPMRDLTVTTAGIALVCLAMAFLLSYWVAYRTAGPVNRLCEKMEAVRQGDLHVTSELSGWKEIRRLNEVFNQMMAETNQLMENIKAEERLKRMAELDFLQSQINPHFLYNTLFSVKCMVSMGKNEEAERMMDLFIKLMRTSISSSNELIPLRDEIHWLAQFIELLQYRYTDAIAVSYQIPESLLDCKIPRMLLQPIVENAIYHGIECHGGGSLELSAVCQDDELQITVSDDGAGMPEETLDKLQTGQWKKSSYNKVGIVNVRERIQVLFGSNYGLTIQSAPGHGTRVTIRIPRIE